MVNKIYTLILVLLFALPVAGQNTRIEVGNAATQMGNTVDLPVNIQHFEAEIEGLEITINYDAEQVHFDKDRTLDNLHVDNLLVETHIEDGLGSVILLGTWFGNPQEIEQIADLAFKLNGEYSEIVVDNAEITYADLSTVEPDIVVNGWLSVPPRLEIEEVIADDLGEVSVPLHFNYFFDIGSAEFKVQFDERIAGFESFAADEEAGLDGALNVEKTNPNELTFTFVGSLDKPLDGVIGEFIFNYKSAFTTDLNFKPGSIDIKDSSFSTITGISSHDGKISPNLDMADGTVMLGQEVPAQIGQQVMVPLIFDDFSKTKTNFTFEIEYEPQKLSFVGIQDEGFEGLQAGTEDGMITVTWFDSQGVEATDELLAGYLVFNYQGNGPTHLDFVPGSEVRDDALGYIFTQFINGSVITDPDGVKVELETKEDVKAGEDVVLDITVSNLPEEHLDLGSAEFKVNFDPLKLSFNEYLEGVLEGWNVNTIEPGVIQFTYFDDEGYVMMEDDVLISLDYTYNGGGDAPVVFTGFEMRTTSFHLVNVNPVDGGVIEGLGDYVITMGQVIAGFDACGTQEIRVPVYAEGLEDQEIQAIDLSFFPEAAGIISFQGFENIAEELEDAGDFQPGTTNRFLWQAVAGDATPIADGKLFDVVYTYYGGDTGILFDVPESSVVNAQLTELSVSYVNGSVSQDLPDDPEIIVHDIATISKTPVVVPVTVDFPKLNQVNPDAQFDIRLGVQGGFPEGATIIGLEVDGESEYHDLDGHYIGGDQFFYLSELDGVDTKTIVEIAAEATEMVYRITLKGFDEPVIFDMHVDGIGSTEECSYLLAEAMMNLEFNDAILTLNDPEPVCFDGTVEVIATIEYPHIQNVCMDIMADALLAIDPALNEGAVIDWDYNGSTEGTFTLEGDVSEIYLSDIVGSQAPLNDHSERTDVWTFHMSHVIADDYSFGVHALAQLDDEDYIYAVATDTFTVWPEPEIEVTPDGPFVIQEDEAPGICFDATFNINIEGVVGEPEWEFLWSLEGPDGDVLTDVPGETEEGLFSQEVDVNTLETGVHTFTITELKDGNGCYATAETLEEYTIVFEVLPEPEITVEPDGPFVILEDETPGICFDANFSINIEGVVGEPEWEFLWSLEGPDGDVLTDVPGETEEGLFSQEVDVNDLVPGVHVFTITELHDGNMCYATEETLDEYTVVFEVLPEPEIEVTPDGPFTDLGDGGVGICFDALFTINIEGITGTPEWEFLWSLEGPEGDVFTDIEGETEDGLFSQEVDVNALVPGEHTFTVTELKDGNDCYATAETLEEYTIVFEVLPEPAVLFAFNDEPVFEGEELHFYTNDEVVVTLHEIIAGTPDITIQWELNGEESDPWTGDAGDIIFETDGLPMGHHTVTLTYLADHHGCEAIAPEETYHLTIQVDPFEVETLAELRQLPDDGTIYKYTGEAVIVAMDDHHNRKFIQDETAAILIHDMPGVITTEYERYDVITNVIGAINIHFGHVRYQPVENTAPAVANTPVNPVVFLPDEVGMDDQAKLIKLEQMMFVDVDPGEVFENGENYAITNGEQEFVLRTDFWHRDYIGEEIPQHPVDISGVIIYDWNELKIVPRDAADIVQLMLAEIPYMEDFTGVDAGDLPQDWTRTHANWAVNDSDFAGGEAPELRFHWLPSGEGTFRAITPQIDGQDIDSALMLEFMHSLDDWSGDYTLKVQTSIDGETWTDQWELYIAPNKDATDDRESSVRNDIAPELVSLMLEGVQGEIFQVAFVFEGNSFNLNQWYIDDIYLDEAFEVTFHVKEDSEAQAPVPGATIHLDHETLTSDEDGLASIMLYNDAYEATVTADGYEHAEVMFTVDGQDKDVEILLMDVIEEPFNLDVTTEGLPPYQALFSWNNEDENGDEDNGDEEEELFFEDFEDGEMPDGWTQVITNTATGGPIPSTWNVNDHTSVDYSPFGNYHAGLWWDWGNQDEWLISPEISIGDDYELEFWSVVFLGSTNNDNYYVKVSTDGGDNWTALWNASDETGGYNYYDSAFILDLGDYAGEDIHIAFRAVDGPTNDGLWYIWFIDNVSVGPEGSKRQMALNDFTAISKAASNRSSAGDEPYQLARDGSVFAYPASPDAGSKVFTGFNVFLNGDEVASNITDTEFLFTELPSGEHTAGVQSVYTTGLSDIIEIDFEVEPVEYQVSFFVMEDTEEKDPIENATIMIDEHELTTDEQGVATIILEIGEYVAHVMADGYETVDEIEFELVDQSLAIDVYMADEILAPHDLQVTTEGLHPREALFSWSFDATQTDKVFTGFNVFINDVEVATDIADHEHLFRHLAGGTYTAGVQAMYTTGQSAIVTIDFDMDDVELPVAGFPFHEDFEDPETHSHWHVIDGALEGAAWQIGDNSYFNVEEPMEGHFAYINSDAAGFDTHVWSILQAPVIDLANYDGGLLALSFDHHYRQLENTEARITVSADGENWEELAVYDTDQGFSTGTETPFDVHPVNEMLLIEGFETGDHLYLQFEFNDYNAWGWYWLIDNIRVEQASEVTFHVKEDSPDEHPIANATIMIDEEIILHTDADGMATTDMLAGEYEAEVTADGYVMEHVSFVVTDEDITVEVHMMDDVEEPHNLAITVDVADATFTWEHPATHGNKVFVGFDVFLNDDLVAEGIEETVYMFTDLPSGMHTAGVRAVYTTDMSAIVTIDFEVPSYTVEFNVFDEFNNTVDDAIITFNGNTYDPGHYIFEDLMVGVYEYEVERDGFYTVAGEVNVVAEDVVVDVEMLVDDTSVIQPEDVELSIYPIPAHSTLYVSSNADIADLRIVDMLGQVVYSASVNDLHHEINVSDLQNGVYFLQMTTSGGVITHRIQVAK